MSDDQQRSELDPDAEPDGAADAQADRHSSLPRPGPHGAIPPDDTDVEVIARAVRRAEKTTKRSFLEVTPRTVVAAEAVTSIDESYDDENDARNRKGSPSHSRACFIATAAYGSVDAPEVEQLRNFRDRRLLTSRLGRVAVRFYYGVSPPVARLIARKPRLRSAIRRTLDFFRSKAAL
jgi:hypothetical protein